MSEARIVTVIFDKKTGQQAFPKMIGAQTDCEAVEMIEHSAFAKLTAELSQMTEERKRLLEALDIATDLAHVPEHMQDDEWRRKENYLNRLWKHFFKHEDMPEGLNENERD